MSKNNLIVGLLGFGNVGSGVASILEKNTERIEKRTGKKIVVKSALVRDLKKPRPGFKKIKFTTKASDILNDRDIDVIVEVLGGEKPAYDHICAALKNKKHVVTANKEVLSKHKKHFFKLAKDNGVDIFYEATVAGGIPIIRTLKVGLAANKIEAIYAILNGTTNYILTKISEDQKSFGEALKDAQKLGFAEADPTMDVSGLDSAYKLDILASVAFKADVKMEQIFYEGIQNVTLKDIVYAKELGYRIKLLAIGRLFENGKMSLKVHPTMIPLSHPLSAVRNELNAVFLIGDAVGETMLSGKGAGANPTGSAVVSDIMDIAFDDHSRFSQRNLEGDLTKLKTVAISETQSQFYLRLLVPDTFGVLEKITGILGRNKVSISKIIQKDRLGSSAEIVIVTHLVKEKSIRQALAGLKKSPKVKKILAVIHVGLEEAA